MIRADTSPEFIVRQRNKAFQRQELATTAMKTVVGTYIEIMHDITEITLGD